MSFKSALSVLAVLAATSAHAASPLEGMGRFLVPSSSVSLADGTRPATSDPIARAGVEPMREGRSAASVRVVR